MTDWSSVFCEFSLVTLKPSVFIDTPMKVSNPDWQELGIEPTDISLRNEVGHSVSPDDLSELPDIIAEMISNPDAWHDRIEEVRSRMIFNLGHGGEAAGRYLLGKILEKQNARAGENVEAKDEDIHDAQEERDEDL